jgi:hypothetical protein
LCVRQYVFANSEAGGHQSGWHRGCERKNSAHDSSAYAVE